MNTENHENNNYLRESLSEKKETAQKVLATLSRQNHTCSPATIHRIARDLLYKWTKPWYTDILTAAQKYKRFLFVEWILRLTPKEMLQLLVL